MNDQIEQSVTDELRLAAYSTTMAGLSAWGNLFTEAADTIDTLRAQLAEAQRGAEVNKQINRACVELPDDFRIAIELERDSGCVYLLQEDEDNGFDDPCDGIARSISAAIDAAKGGADGIR